MDVRPRTCTLAMSCADRPASPPITVPVLLGPADVTFMISPGVNFRAFETAASSVLPSLVAKKRAASSRSCNTLEVIQSAKIDNKDTFTFFFTLLKSKTFKEGMMWIRK